MFRLKILPLYLKVRKNINIQFIITFCTTQGQKSNNIDCITI